MKLGIARNADGSYVVGDEVLMAVAQSQGAEIIEPMRDWPVDSSIEIKHKPFEIYVNGEQCK